jgi:hypothetical protein
MSLELTFDRRGGKRRELEVATGVETLDRLQQADERDLPQIIELFTAVRESTREVRGQPLMGLDQFVPELPLARPPVLDELRSLHLTRIGVHARDARLAGPE